MKNVRKLDIIKEKLMPLLLAGGIAFTLSSCGNVDASQITTKDLLAIETVQNVTLMDELLDEGMLMYDQSANIVEQVDRLERYMNIVDKVSTINYEGVDKLRPLSDDEYEAIPLLSDDEIDELIEQATTKEKDLKSTEDKLIALKKLEYLKRYCDEWINKKGKSISIDFMLSAVKSSVACELNIGTEDYSKISLPPLLSHDPESSDYVVEVGDKKYIVKSSAEELWNTINYIYSVQSANKISDDTRFATFRKAINYGKTTIAAGCNIKNDRLEEQYDAKYIRENIIKTK